MGSRMNLIKFLSIYAMLLLVNPLHANAQSIFKPDNCEFNISFPGEPKVSELEFANGLTANKAEYFGKESYYRAECASINNTELLNLKAMMMKQAELDALEGVGIESGEDTVGSYYKLRGYKTIDGRVVTFKIKSYSGVNSFVVLYAAEPSSVFPTDNIHLFLSKGITLRK